MARTTKKKGLTHKQIGYVIAGFGVFLLGGLVWAATVGQLQIGGTVSRGDSVDLDFINASCISPRSGFGTDGVTTAGAAGGAYSCGYTIANIGGRANGANDRLNFGIFLDEPGASDTVQFYIKNVGAVGADMDAINITDKTGFTGSATDNSITLGGSYTGIVAQCIPVGSTIGPFTISATWPSSATSATGGATFSAEMDYEQGSC